MYTNIKLIIIKLIARRPLNPSIRLAPLTMNKRHNNTNADEKKLLFINIDKYGTSMFKILIGMK
jgi:hypothetical protein